MIFLANIDDFLKLDIRVGEITRAEEFKEARNPSYKLWVDFGETIGIKKSSAQITEKYSLDDLMGKSVLGVVNFPKRQIANFMSEVLVLGVYTKDGVVLISPDKETEKGDKLG